MHALTTFGLFSVTAMLVCYALEDRSPWFVLFAVACALGSVTDSFRALGPFGVIEAISAAVAVRRWRIKAR